MDTSVSLRHVDEACCCRQDHQHVDSSSPSSLRRRASLLPHTNPKIHDSIVDHRSHRTSSCPTRISVQPQPQWISHRRCFAISLERSRTTTKKAISTTRWSSTPPWFTWLLSLEFSPFPSARLRLSCGPLLCGPSGTFWNASLVPIDARLTAPTQWLRHHRWSPSTMVSSLV